MKRLVRFAVVLVLASCGTTSVAPDAAPAAPAPPPTEDEIETTGDPRAGPAPVQRDEPAPPPPPPGQIDPRDQYALGNEIERARLSDPEQIDRRYAAIRRNWGNRRYRWEMNVTGTFCREGACAVLPYDHARSGFRGDGSYLPVLRTTADSQRRITELCRPFASCILRFEGVLSRFDLSTFEATHLELTEINVLGARAARPNERWIRPVNVPPDLVRIAREVGDAGAIRLGPATPQSQRLDSLIQRIRGSAADGGTARTPSAPPPAHPPGPP